MQSTSTPTQSPAIRQSQNLFASGRAARAAMVRPKAGARYPDPLDCAHPYDSMRRFAQLLALRFDMVRTRHSYYRDMRLLHEHFQSDPAALTEEQLRDYILHVRTRKHWKPKTVHQTAAAARLLVVDLLEHDEWKVFNVARNGHHIPAHGSLAAVGDQQNKVMRPGSGRESTSGRLWRPLRGAARVVRRPTATPVRCRGLTLVAAPGHVNTKGPKIPVPQIVLRRAFRAKFREKLTTLAATEPRLPAVESAV